MLYAQHVACYDSESVEQPILSDDFFLIKCNMQMRSTGTAMEYIINFLQSSRWKYKVAFRRVYAAVTNVFPQGFSLLSFFFPFLHIQNKWTWYISLSELSIFALQLRCSNSRPKPWVTAKQSPASSREMFLWKQRMCLRRLHPLWTLISRLQAPTLWIMLFVAVAPPRVQ